MKKRFNIFIIISIVILLIISFILIIHFTRPEKLVIYGITKHYSLIYEDYPTLKVNSYLTNNVNNYFDLGNIEKATINTATDTFQTKIIEAKITDNKQIIKDLETYEAYYVLKLDFTSDDMILLKDATLDITFKTNESLSLKLGNICFQKAVTDNVFRTSKIQSIVNDLGGVDSIVAVNIELDAFDDCEIINIIPLSASININNDYILEDSTLEISNEMSYTSLFGDNYNPYIQSIKSFPTITLTKNLTKKIVIPFKYSEKELVDSIGFIVVIKVGDKIVKQIINPYCLFSTSNFDYVTYEYQIIKD